MPRSKSLCRRTIRGKRFVQRFYYPCRFDYGMLLLSYMPANVCMRRGPFCERAVLHKHEHYSSEPALTNKQGKSVYASF